jgi:anhydro-N-acetylmuramic acid kinase
VVYHAIGVMSGSSLDGLDIAYVELTEQAGQWSFEIRAADCFPYNEVWKKRLQQAIELGAQDYQQLHADFGHYIGSAVRRFMNVHSLDYKVGLIASHGHTTFHSPATGMTGQLGDGAAIASELALPVVTDLRALDVALGGQGAPIVPVGERLLMGNYSHYLNIGGIANVSVNADPYIAFDVCPANRVLNLLVSPLGMEMDEDGKLAAAGKIDADILDRLNALAYYAKPYPKSLANQFGTEVVLPIVEHTSRIPDALATFVEHIAIQVKRSVEAIPVTTDRRSMLVTGGGALNKFLVSRLEDHLGTVGIGVEVPNEKLVQFKEALIMAFIGVLRWRQEANVLSSVTGARVDSVGGALWMG